MAIKICHDDSGERVSSRSLSLRQEKDCLTLWATCRTERSVLRQEWNMLNVDEFDPDLVSDAGIFNPIKLPWKEGQGKILKRRDQTKLKLGKRFQFLSLRTSLHGILFTMYHGG